MILSDNETKVDLLNNEAIAKTIVAVLQERPNNPITIGVHGDWGAGKSSILEMVEAALDGSDRVLCLKFNGWRFQGFEDAKIALMEGVVTGLLEKRPFLQKTTASVKDVLHRIDLLKLAKRTGGLVASAAAFYSGHHQLGMMALASGLGIALTKPDNFTKEKIGEAFEGAKELFKEKEKGESSSVPEDVAAFRKAFDQLLTDAKIDQLIVLIDDLDRCLPETAIETLEAIRLFVFTSRTAFVVAADEAMIEYCVRKHFPDLPDTTGPQSYARNYLEKLIQVPFRIPALGQTETRIYVTLLLVGAELGESDPSFDRLIQEARELLTRPWLGGTLDAARMKSAFGEDRDKERRTNNALMISEQVGPILASGTRGNPRQIKRFLNTLLLRQASANARGFGDDVKLPALAKLMLVERFNPRVFEQIATAAASAPDGTCADLHGLESAVARKAQESDLDATKTTAKSKKSEPTVEVVKPEPSPILTEWLNSEITKDWARLSPPLAKLDLRPYLFVAKDRKDFFGVTTLLGQIAAIAEKLLGPKIAVQQEASSLKQLAPPEAAQVFATLRTRIVSSASFDKQPDGIAGMEVLVRAQPHLQASLLDFLESLPVNRLGGWVCSGWANVLKDSAALDRFHQLLESWSKNGSVALRATASAAMLSGRQGGR